jgi:hypothetical protein
MNKEFLQAYALEFNQEEPCSEPIIDEALKPLYDTAVEHDETNQKLRG